MQNPRRNFVVSSTTDDDDDASSCNQWGKRLSTSLYALGTAAYKPSHHSSPSKHRFSAGRLRINPSFDAVASIFIVDDVKHCTAVSLRTLYRLGRNITSSRRHLTPTTLKWYTITLLLLPRGRVVLVSVEGVETQVCY